MNPAREWAPVPLQRVLVVGPSGAGKSTLALALAARLYCPHIELDALYWGPDWTPQPPLAFHAAVEAAAAGERWVIDGNYGSVRALLWPRATHVLWLDYGRGRTMAQLLRRTLRRVATRQALWHGNRESFARVFLSRESILVWAWTTHERRRQDFARLRDAGVYPQLRWLRFERPADAECWLQRP